MSLIEFLQTVMVGSVDCFLLIGWGVPQASWSTATFTSKIEGNFRRVLIKQAFLSPRNFSSVFNGSLLLLFQPYLLQEDGNVQFSLH